MNNKYRKVIAKKVRELRLERHWTQTRLARLLNLSQNRLSEIENGQGSFTAEHLISILTVFNVSLDYFAKTKASAEEQLQNILERLGAAHLKGNSNILPTDRIKNVLEAVRETLATAKSPRLITALAPVIVYHADSEILNQLRYDLEESKLGLIYRYGWVLRNVLDAIQNELQNTELSVELRNKYKHAERVINHLVGSSKFSLKAPKKKNGDLWGIDAGINSQKTFEDVKKHSSRFSKAWGIVTRLQPKDFVEALRYARENH